jgi:hypothetical protein
MELSVLDGSGVFPKKRRSSDIKGGTIMLSVGSIVITL